MAALGDEFDSKDGRGRRRGGDYGAPLIASNTLVSRYGWVGFSISNNILLLSGFAIHIRAWWMLSMQVCFSITYMIGLWRWLIEPALTAGVH